MKTIIKKKLDFIQIILLFIVVGLIFLGNNNQSGILRLSAYSLGQYPYCVVSPNEGVSSAPTVFNFSSSGIPANTQNQACSACESSGNSDADESWISNSGQPTITSDNLSSTGQQSITLQINQARMFCDFGYFVLQPGFQQYGTNPSPWPTDNLIIGTELIDTASITSSNGDSLTMSNINNDELTQSVSSGNLWNITQSPQSFTVSGNFTGNQTITVNMQYQQINVFRKSSGDVASCVGGNQNIQPYNVSSQNDFNNGSPSTDCRIFTATYSININFASGGALASGNGCSQTALGYGVSGASFSIPAGPAGSSVSTGSPTYSFYVKNNGVNIGSPSNVNPSSYDGYNSNTFIVYETWSVNWSYPTYIDPNGQSQPGGGGTISGGPINISQTSIGPCFSGFSCGSLSPTRVQVNKPNDYTATFIMNPTQTGSYSFGANASPAISSGQMTLSFSNGQSTTVSGNNITESYNGSNSVVSATVNNYSLNTSFNGTANYSFSYDGQSQPCSSSPFYSYVKPFFTVHQGDVLAGSAFGNNPYNNNCSLSTNPSSNIEAWNNGPSSYSGSGANDLVEASGSVNGFTSSNNPAQSIPDLLTIANKPNSVVGTYGGLANQVPCMPNYFANAPSSNSNQLLTSNDSNLTGSTVDPSTISSTLANNCSINCSFYYDALSTPLIINQAISSSAIPAGSHITLYVNGNVYIDGNINYNYPANLSTNTAALPSFTLIVQGNIYIDPSVTVLNGLYIAETSTSSTSTTNTGTIYTCANSDGPISSHYYSTCLNQLIVYGSFQANQVDLERTGDSSITPYATVYNAPANSASCGQDSYSAEQFCYSPITWLGQPTFQTPGTYNAVGTLPPIL